MREPPNAWRIVLAALFAIVATVTAFRAQAQTALDERLRRLETDLRCLVCQNQTLADSNAGLADDLRRAVRALAVAGKSDDEIRAYLVERYGDFVLYDPPIKPTTWLLWFGPFALLCVGGGVWWIILRRRRRAIAAADAIDDATQRRADESARKLLDEDD